MSKTALVLSVLIYVMLQACQVADEAGPKGVFMGLKPTDTPQLFPGFINSAMVEFNGTFSLDGTAFYYTTDIPRKGMIAFTSMLEDSSWTTPALASFSGTYSDYDPLFSPDGKRLYFSSRRPVSGESTGRSNIWFVERVNKEWTSPVYVFLDDLSAYYSTQALDGSIYFNAGSPGRLHKATATNTESYLIEPLQQMLGGTESELDPFIAPDESYLIFRGYGEKSYGRADLFISFNLNGQWTPAENLGEKINSPAQEVCPYVTADGQFFIFSSDKLTEPYPTAPMTPLNEFHLKFGSSDNGQQNIYYMSADFIDVLRQKHLACTSC